MANAREPADPFALGTFSTQDGEPFPGSWPRAGCST